MQNQPSPVVRASIFVFLFVCAIVGIGTGLWTWGVLEMHGVILRAAGSVSFGLLAFGLVLRIGAITLEPLFWWDGRL